jgi:hypothetical protein
MFQRSLAAYPFVVDERPVQATQIAKDKLRSSKFDDAVFFGNDLIEQLNRVVGVSPQRVHGSQLDGLLPFGGLQDQSSHRNLYALRASVNRKSCPAPRR